MQIVIFFAGVLVGGILQILRQCTYQRGGFIDVDPHTEQCLVHLDPNDLNNKKIKKVILTVNHDRKISREDQGL